MTDNPDSITMRLEAYLIQLANINLRWTEWLRQQERAAFSLDIESMNDLRQAAEQLMAELSEMQSSRSRLLQDADQLGLPARSLQTLARGLPAWERSSLRRAITAARQQLANIRRLHVAAWVLIQQLGQFYTGTLMLLTEGSAVRPVYIGARDADTGGGHLLDADL